MRVLISGATGLVGTGLAGLLGARGDQVLRLTRGPAAPGAVPWDPQVGALDPRALEGLDAVVHLAGENIAGGRWTPARKARIRESRVQGTRLLCERLAQCQRPPAVLASASAIGYYGDRGEALLSEDSPSGQGFLAEVCRAWEEAAEPARTHGLRVAHLRFGMILSARGGALARMLLPFRLGLGGRIGSGRQYLSWIALDDALRVLCQVLDQPTLRGPLNVVAPQPCTNAEFTQTLGQVLRRPTVLPLPAWAARLALGEMAEGLLLSSQRVLPARLLESGFRFELPDLAGALRQLLRA